MPLYKTMLKNERSISMKMKTALTIAGSDCSGGAGIQADLKTMTMNGVYAMSAITALTAQNTTGVRAIQESTPEFLKHQLDAIFEDIFPDAVKIGMVSSAELIKVIADRLKIYKAKSIVVDPVMVATSGSSLMKTDAVSTLMDELLPIADVVTPNIPEAEILSGMAVSDKEDMIKAAKKSAIHTDVPCFSRAVITSMMQMICYTQMEISNGSMANESIIPTPMGRGVRCHQP